MFRKAYGLALVWAGTAGASVTLFGNLLAAPDMADWAWALVAPWQDWTPELWDWFAVRAGLTLPNWLVPPLNFAALLLLTAIGVGILGQGNRERVVLKYPVLQLLAGLGLVVKQLWFMLGGVGVLVTLNEVSKFATRGLES